jgi:hypothetical protein
VGGRDGLVFGAEQGRERIMKALWHGKGDVRVDPFFVIHRVRRDDGREADHTFRDKQAGSVKVVMTP